MPPTPYHALVEPRSFTALRQDDISPSAAAEDSAAALRDLISRGALHELYAGRASDTAATFGLAVGLTLQAADGRAILCVRHSALDAEHGALHAPGLREMGLDPGRLILLKVRDSLSALQGGLEGARCPALGAVLIEIRGDAPRLDLTASRRLLLAAERSRVPVLLLRSEAEPRPSAAETRWHVRSAPSLQLEARAPGRPTFDLTLLRRRNGRGGLRYIVEWNRDAGHFEERIIAQPRASDAGSQRGAASPALSGSVVSLSVDRPGAGEAPQGALRRRA